MFVKVNTKAKGLSKIKTTKVFECRSYALDDWDTDEAMLFIYTDDTEIHSDRMEINKKVNEIYIMSADGNTVDKYTW